MRALRLPVTRASVFLGVALCVWIILGTGCSNPIAATRVAPREAYRRSLGSALSHDVLTSDTRLVLRRYNLEQEFEAEPAVALRYLHDQCCVDDRHDILYALAELSYFHAEHLQRTRDIKPWIPKPAADYFLSSALYAYMYLLSSDERISPFDTRYHVACDLYNQALARGLNPHKHTNGPVQLRSGSRELPQGPIQIEFHHDRFPYDIEQFDVFLPADQFVVRGLSLRNQRAGIGAPLIGVMHPDAQKPFALRVPGTVLLRFDGDAKDWTAGRLKVSLELYSGFNKTFVELAGHQVPLRTDTTAPLAHTMNESVVWSIGVAQFFSGHQTIKTAVYPNQPYQFGRIPVVFVHGTLSSPVWWAEMWNTLSADPVLSERCQFWNYIYNTGNSLPFSAANFRDALTNILHEVDPEGKDPALRQMVIIGHSQGGVLAKMASCDPGAQLWNELCAKSPDEMELTPQQRVAIDRFFLFKPLPFVSRVVFIATPHRGSFLAKSWVRKLAARTIKLPSDLVRVTHDLLTLGDQLKLPPEFRKTVPTSVDGMSPKNEVLLCLAKIPPAPGVKAHSIIAVKRNGWLRGRNDGVVQYTSAHVDYAESERVVNSFHTCQDKPETIEEVRRILIEHLSKK
jgi:pimeloyl-ACP methyl ester carboxylesterase